MSVEAVFYTQLGSILAFIVTLLVLYRVLVKSKDATIQMQKENIAFLKDQVEALGETSPDVLLQRYETRNSLLTNELEKAEREKEPLQRQLDEVKSSLLEMGTKTEAEKKALINRLIIVTVNAAALEERHNQVRAELEEIQKPYMQFLHHANAEVSEGRQYIVGEIAQYLGLDFVINSSPTELMKSFEPIYHEVNVKGRHTETLINRGAMSGLRSVGIISDKGELTLLGASVFKTVSKEIKVKNSN